jgi:hypothetical protein
MSNTTQERLTADFKKLPEDTRANFLEEMEETHNLPNLWFIFGVPTAVVLIWAIILAPIWLKYV